MTDQLGSMQKFLSIVAVVAMVAPLAIVIVAFTLFSETPDRARCIVAAFQLLVQGIGVAFGLRALMALGETDGATYRPRIQNAAA